MTIDPVTLEVLADLGEGAVWRHGVIEGAGTEVVDQLHGVDVVGDAEVGPHLLPLDGPGVDASQVTGMGLMIYDKQDGPFELRLASVHAY